MWPFPHSAAAVFRTPGFHSGPGLLEHLVSRRYLGSELVQQLVNPCLLCFLVLQQRPPPLLPCPTLPVPYQGCGWDKPRGAGRGRGLTLPGPRPSLGSQGQARAVGRSGKAGSGRSRRVPTPSATRSRVPAQLRPSWGRPQRPPQDCWAPEPRCILAAWAERVP